MQKRERILLVLLIATLVVWWGRPVLLSWFIAPLQSRTENLEALRSQLELKEAEQLQVLQATRRLTEYRAQGLPPDPNAAQRAYTAWLTDLLDNSGWRSQEVLPGKITRFLDLGSAVQVRIDGEATSEQLARFLSGFEESGLLHRLERLSVQGTSIEPDAVLNISLIAEAISLKAAERESLEGLSAKPRLADYWSRFAQASLFTKSRPQTVLQPDIALPASLAVDRGNRLQQRVEVSGFAPELEPIRLRLEAPTANDASYDQASRNLIWQTSPETEPGDYPLTLVAVSEASSQELLRKTVSIKVRIPNTPPQWTITPAPQVLYPAQNWSLPLAARDGDLPEQQLTFSLSGTTPAGLAIDPATGQLNWNPLATLAGQTFSVTVVVTDNGDPPLKASLPLSLQVARDTEKATELIGCIQVDGDWTAWFADREQPRRFAVKAGETLQVGRFQGRLERIEVDRIVLQSADERSELLLGKKLAERTVLPPVAPVPPPPAS